MITHAAVIESRRLDELVEHPRQHETFDRLSAFDLKALADDIERNGLQNKIEILPADNQAGLPSNTILRGHQRRRAQLLRGLADDEVLVLHNLASADRATVDRYFLEDNLNRRQLDTVAKARVALALYSVEVGRSSSKLSDAQYSTARDRIGATIGMSGRNLQRYWNVLQAPVAVQDAFRGRQLKLTDAARVGLLSTRDKQAIAKRIESGECPANVVAEFLQGRDRDRGKTADFISSLLFGLRRADDLVAHIEDVPPHRLVENVARLQNGLVAIETLLEHAQGTDCQ